jgi:Type IV secretion-system coupling protein DNA-binding domain
MVKGSSGFEGFETLTNSFLMGLKMHVMLLLFVACCHGFVVSHFIDVKSYDTRVVLNWYKVKAMATMPKNKLTSFPLPNGEFMEERVKTLAERSDIREYVEIVEGEWLALFYKTSFMWLLYPFFLYLFVLRTRKQLETEFVRGAVMITPKEHRKLIKPIQDKNRDIPIGNIFMPHASEIRMTLTIGRPGTGKTVLYNQIMEKIVERNEKGLIYDIKGDYFCKFYRPDTDILLNPLDERNIGWNFFNEIKNETDIAAFAASIIPLSPKEAPFWTNAPRAIFTGMVTYLLIQEKRTNKDLWALLTSTSNKIHKCLKKINHYSLRYIEDPESRQSQGVLSKLIEHTSCFGYVAKCDGDFCISDWMQDEDHKGMLYLTTSETVQETLRPLLSLWIDISVMRLLEMPNDLRRRRFFMLDELGTLQRMNMLIKGLTLSRSKGGAFFLAIQDIGLLEDQYGKLRQTIVNACGNFITFAVEDNDVAEFCSAKFAEADELIKTRNLSIGVNDFRDGVNVSQQRRKDRLLLPAEIKALPDLSAIAKIANVTITDKSTFDKIVETVYVSYKNKSIVLAPVNAHLRYKTYPTLWSEFKQRKDLDIWEFIYAIQERIDDAEKLAQDIVFEDFEDLPLEEYPENETEDEFVAEAA